MKEGRKGFTLIELLVVIAIIALLSSVVLTSLSTARMKSRDAKRISDLRQIAIAISMYADANGVFPKAGACVYNTLCFAYSYNTTWDTLQTTLAPYMAKLPKDPINSACQPWSASPCYSYAYGNVGNGTVSTDNINAVHSYDLVVRLETPNHPQSCGNWVTKFKFNTLDWCPTYSVQLYDGSLD